MASSNKRKTTMAKLNRERGLAERRLAKQARRAARKQAATHQEESSGRPSQEEAQPLASRPAVDAATDAFGRIAKTDAQEQKRE
jgi:hypothetical protein